MGFAAYQSIQNLYASEPPKLAFPAVCAAEGTVFLVKQHVGSGAGNCGASPEYEVTCFHKLDLLGGDSLSAALPALMPWPLNLVAAGLASITFQPHSIRYLPDSAGVWASLHTHTVSGQML